MRLSTPLLDQALAYFFTFNPDMSIIIAGVLLGDPYGENLFVEHPTITRKDVRSLEALSKSDQKLALALVDLFFPKDVQAASLATKKEDRDLLDQNIIEGIRCK